MATSKWELAGRALEVLARGLGPFGERRIAAFLPPGRDWLEVMAERARRSGRPARLVRSDPRLLLQVIGDNPRAFRGVLSRLELAFAQEIRESAHKWAHYEPFSRPDTSRMLDTTVRLLRAVGAPAEADEASQLLSASHEAAPATRYQATDREAGGAVDAVASVLREVTSEARIGEAVAEFRDRDHDYLAWVEAHRDGYVINIGRSGRGYARVHVASCPTITSRPPFTGPYMKVCGLSLGQLDDWALQRNGAAAHRCGICHPPSAVMPGPQGERTRSGTAGTTEPAAAGGPSWRAGGPQDGMREVWLQARHYIPFERLSPEQRDARDELRRRLRLLRARRGEILHAAYAGPKPANADVENLVLYNIDTAAHGCFRSAARYGIRFELAADPYGGPPPAPSACCYRYRLISPASDLAHWRRERLLARFTGADLGRFPSTRRLEQAWLAIHRAEAEFTSEENPAGAPFAVSLTLSYPRAGGQAGPELVKALIDAATAAFQAHSDATGLGEIARRLAAATGEQPGAITAMLCNHQRAVLGAPGMLVYLRGAAVQWNPGDQMCVAGQVTCEPADGPWTLSGEIHALQPRHDAAVQ